ncbi:MAG: glycosyltransferase family 39 protein [Planctomycetaceae bacterium]|nr:glycosyltransferase family 39 protein [Planctomycetaceae bacterium]
MPSRPLQTAIDIAAMVALALVIIVNSATAPSNFYKYAQMRQAGAAMGMIEEGDILTPHTHAGGLMRKGQIFNLVAAGAVLLTGVHDDWVFCLPSAAAAIATVLLVYALGRRWFGRRVGLLSGVLWLTMLHMRKLVFLATTDMMLTLWIVLAVFCLDRLLFHRGRRSVGWAMGLWAAMILAALTKGWGVVNLPLIGGLVALAAAVGPGFGAASRVGGFLNGLAVSARLVGRRWWRAIMALQMWWGLPLMLLAVCGILWAMAGRAGGEFMNVLKFEILQRATGQGAHAPKAASLPAFASLIYYALPASVFAIGALFQVRPRKWLTRDGGIYLPLIWILVTVVLFTLPHGFRPDYLLPCYAGVAILGAWSVEEVVRRGSACRTGRILRHLYALTAIVIGAGGAILALLLALHSNLPLRLAAAVPMPATAVPLAMVLLWAAVALGAATATWAIVASLRWRVAQVAAAACIGMLPLLFSYEHFLSEPARGGDGETMRQFCRQASRIIGKDRVITFWADWSGFALYHGRFCPILSTSQTLTGNERNRLLMTWRQMQQQKIEWLVTCDRGLVEMGQFADAAPGATDEGLYRIKDGKQWRAFKVLPDLIAQRIALQSPPVKAYGMGRFYLIRLKSGAAIHGKPGTVGHVNSDRDAEDDGDDTP